MLGTLSIGRFVGSESIPLGASDWLSKLGKAVKANQTHLATTIYTKTILVLSLMWYGYLFTMRAYLIHHIRVKVKKS